MSPPLELTTRDGRKERGPSTPEAAAPPERARLSRPTTIVFLRPKLTIAVGRHALTVDVRPGLSSAT